MSTVKEIEGQINEIMSANSSKSSHKINKIIISYIKINYCLNSEFKTGVRMRLL